MIRQCAIMAGGLGTRLGAVTEATPKPILDVGGRPFLAWLLRELARFGIEEVLLLTGFRTDRLRAAMPAITEHIPRKMQITISEELRPAGTGGALWNARHLLHDRFLVCNGDSLFAANLSPLLVSTDADDEHVVGRLMLRHVPDAARYGIVDLTGDRVTAFREKQGDSRPAWINAGIYAFDRRILDSLSDNCSLERDVLTPLAFAGRLKATQGTGYFIDIGIPADLARARAELSQRVRRPALFLSRNCVAGIDPDSAGSYDTLQWIDTAIDTIRLATERGWHVFMVPHRSCSADPRYSRQQDSTLWRRIADEVRMAGGTIDDLANCSHNARGVYGRDDGAGPCAEPDSGALRKLIETWEVGLHRALFIGGDLAGVRAAQTAGIESHLFPGGNLVSFVHPFLNAAEHILNLA